MLFVLAVLSTYEGISKVSFSEPSKPLGIELPEEEPIRPTGTIPETPPPNQVPPPVVIEEDTNGNGNSIIKLLEEPDLLLDKIPVRKTKPISGGRSTTRRQRIPYSRPPPLVIGLSAAIGVLGFLLLLSIAVYFYLRHKVHRNDLSRRGRSRRPSDRQGLTMHGSTSTIELVF